MENFKNFLDQVFTLKKKLNFKDAEECFFRGHPDANYKLLPNILRDPGKYSLKKEESLFFEFRSKFSKTYNNNMSDWDILLYMQHYGCKTRLLDWSDNFGTALYFALSGYVEGKSPTIFLLNPYALNEKFRGWRDLYDPEKLNHKDGYSYSEMIQVRDPNNIAESVNLGGSKIWWEEPIALYPVRTTDRLSAQSGYFTIQGNNLQPLEEQLEGYENSIWSKIMLPEKLVPEAKQYLELFGINDFSIYPDFVGLSQYLNKKYNL